MDDANAKFKHDRMHEISIKNRIYEKYLIKNL